MAIGCTEGQFDRPPGGAPILPRPPQAEARMASWRRVRVRVRAEGLMWTNGLLDGDQA